MSGIPMIVYMPSGDGKGTMPAPNLMTGEEVARYLRLDCVDVNEALWQYRKRGLIKAGRIGRKTIYRLPDVVELGEKLLARNPQ